MLASCALGENWAGSLTKFGPDWIPWGMKMIFRKEARRLSYTKTQGSLRSQMLILLHVQIQAAASNQSPVPEVPWVLFLTASSFLKEALYV